MEHQKENLFSNKLFRKLFLSYVVLILSAVIGFSLWYLYSYSDHYRTVAEENARQQAVSFATAVDRNLLTAQGLCGAMNASESIRNLYQAIFVEQKTPDSMQLYRTQTELSRIKASAEMLDIYDILLGFSGGNKLYAPGKVIALQEAVTETPGNPWTDITNVVSLLRLKGVSNIILNKEFLIYSEAYTGGGHGLNRGFCMVLMEKNLVESRARELANMLDHLVIRNGSRIIYESGEAREGALRFQIDSLVTNPVSYEMQVSSKLMEVPFPLEALIPLMWMAVGGLLFAGGCYLYLRKRYHPISTITRMVSTEADAPEIRKDMDAVVQEISGLIGERNGYRERMITISPFVNRGALHQLISGNMGEQQIQVLQEEQFLGLRSGYYMVGLVNLAEVSGGGAAEARYLDARSLAEQACQDLATEEYPVATLARDSRNLYAVVSGEKPEGLADVFFRMLPKIEEALDDPDLAVTIGVSGIQTELELLREACRSAARTLENMMTGGRGSVYFAEEESQASPAYDFPRDLQGRFVRDLRENNPEDIRAAMAELWDKNIRRASLSPEEARKMVEELYLCVNGALREISEQSVTHLRAERMNEPATIEEIFAYYQSVLLEACRTYQREMTGEQGEAAVEKEILAYINEHILDPDLSLTGVADHFGVSGKLVGSVCKNAYGKTYLQYVRDCQIQHAAELLQTTDLPLAEIAERCGFTNLLTFRRNFKATMNVNPSDYRKE